MNYLKKHYRLYLAEIFLAVAVTCLAIAIPATSKVYATEEYWTVNAGEKVLAVVTTESQANSIVDKIKSYYKTDGATNVVVKLDPELTIVHKTVQAGETPEVVKDVDKTVEKIVTGGGEKEKAQYTVKDGDTFWSIASAHGISVDELLKINNATSDSTIVPGSTLYVEAFKPLLNVEITQTVVQTKDVPFNTEYKDDSSMYKGEEKVVQEGQNGQNKETVSQVLINGKVTQTNVLSTEVVKAPVNKIINKGTKARPVAQPVNVARTTRSASNSSSASSSRSYMPAANYGGSGSSIANFATQFTGNRYVYGGTSLTNGADCSGFVMSVYGNFGISLPRTSQMQSHVGYSVPLSQAQPGDIVIYRNGGHSAIYLGGGRIVHALNPRLGIMVTGTNLAGSLPTDVRRVI